MHELALMAATEWARVNSTVHRDPVEFGNKVALVYCACKDTLNLLEGNKDLVSAIARYEAAVMSASQMPSSTSIADEILRSAGYGPDSTPPEAEPQDFSPKTPKPPSPAAVQSSGAPSFHGVAVGKAEWFEVSALAVDSASQPAPFEADQPASVQSPPTAASPAVAPFAQSDSPSCAEAPETNEETPPC